MTRHDEPDGGTPREPAHDAAEGAPAHLPGEAPPELLQFADLYNRGEYYESHDCLEELWREVKLPLWQGLIQVSVSLYHLGRGNLNGARRQAEKARRNLAGYPPDAVGINLGEFQTFLEDYLAALRFGATPPPPPKLKIRP